jgi:putative YphP/YqiW family bacilliredoxin
LIEGQDKEATQQARDYFEGYAPSSPSFALIKDGKITVDLVIYHNVEHVQLLDVQCHLHNHKQS